MARIAGYNPQVSTLSPTASNKPPTVTTAAVSSNPTASTNSVTQVYTPNAPSHLNEATFKEMAQKAKEAVYEKIMEDISSMTTTMAKLKDFKYTGNVVRITDGPQGDGIYTPLTNGKVSLYKPLNDYIYYRQSVANDNINNFLSSGLTVLQQNDYEMAQRYYDSLKSYID